MGCRRERACPAFDPPRFQRVGEPSPDPSRCGGWGAYIYFTGEDGHCGALPPRPPLSGGGAHSPSQRMRELPLRVSSCRERSAPSPFLCLPLRGRRRGAPDEVRARRRASRRMRVQGEGLPRSPSPCFKIKFSPPAAAGGAGGGLPERGTREDERPGTPASGIFTGRFLQKNFRNHLTKRRIRGII